MIVKISSWDGKMMHTVKEQKVNTLDEIISEIKWMNERDVHGMY